MMRRSNLRTLLYERHLEVQPRLVIGAHDLAEAELDRELGLAHRERRRREHQNADDHRDDRTEIHGWPLACPSCAALDVDVGGRGGRALDRHGRLRRSVRDARGPARAACRSADRPDCRCPSYPARPSCSTSARARWSRCTDARASPRARARIRSAASTKRSASPSRVRDLARPVGLRVLHLAHGVDRVRAGSGRWRTPAPPATSGRGPRAP